MSLQKITTKQLPFTLALLLLCGLGRAGRAGTWTEVGDAPATLPGQTTVGSGSLTSIAGQILNGTDANLYKIYITDPANFSATIDSSHYQPLNNLDTMMWLFDANGKGVEANDDKGLDPSLPQGYDPSSWLLPNVPGTSNPNPYRPQTAGFYYLALSSWLYVPEDAFGAEIFPNVENDGDGNGDATLIVGPGTGSLLSLSPGPLSQWSQEDAEPSGDNGAYTIVLNGATFAATPVPEPSSVALTLLGIAGLGPILRIRASRRRAREAPSKA